MQSYQPCVEELATLVEGNRAVEVCPFPVAQWQVLAFDSLKQSVDGDVGSLALVRHRLRCQWPSVIPRASHD